MKLRCLVVVLLALAGCAHPPKLATSVDIRKNSDDLVLLKLKVTNLEDRVTVPVAIELTGQARTNNEWSKPETLLHPAAFVLNRKEQREITKFWHVQADGVRTTLTLKEQESGRFIKSEKFEKVFSGAQPATTSQR